MGHVTRLAKVGLAATVALVVAFGTVACETNATPVGLTRDDRGQLVAVVRPCHADAVVYAITVERLDNHLVVWEISSGVGSQDRSFTLGLAPPNFEQLVPYSAEPGARLRITFRTSELADEYGNVDPVDARNGTVLVDGKHLTPQQFGSRNTCG